MQQLGHTFHFHATRMENPSKQCDVQPFQIEFLDAWAKQGPICLELQQCDILSRLTATGGGTFKKVSVSPNSFEFQATRIENCSGSASDKESNKARPIKSLTQVAVGHPGAILDCNRRSSKAIPGDWHTRHGRPTGRKKGSCSRSKLAIYKAGTIQQIIPSCIKHNMVADLLGS